MHRKTKHSQINLTILRIYVHSTKIKVYVQLYCGILKKIQPNEHSLFKNPKSSRISYFGNQSFIS